jgi:solute:Na+ symporter, SSS family
MRDRFDLAWIDYAIILVYFAFVLGIGWILRRYMKDAKAFLEAGRSISSWVAGLAFISTSLGALEIMGMIGCGAKYGMLTFHFYWIGAIPAMVFLGVFMMPFYYGSRARSVPEYLKLRYDEKTRALNAILFSVMTILMSGISMYAIAILAEQLLGWNFFVALIISAGVVLSYTYLGGLSSAIHNEVLQFFIVIAGLLPLVLLSLKDAGGWRGLHQHLAPIVSSLPGRTYASDTWTTTWRHTGQASANPMGIAWYGIVLGLGFVLSFGYWCTDFLVIQRALSAKSLLASRNTPLIAAMAKMLIPFLIIPGIAAMWLMHDPGAGFSIMENGRPNYDLTIIMLMKHYLPSGLLGLGLTALLASFMSGMAGNISAFNTVWTYDLYQAYIHPSTSDEQKDSARYLKMARLATIFGVIASIGTACIAAQFQNITDFMQTIFSMVNAPLFAVIFLGMFWKRATGHGAFAGLVSGLLIAVLHHGLTKPAGSSTLLKGGWLHVVHIYPVELAQNFWSAILACFTSMAVAILVSLLTAQRRHDHDLAGLVYQLTPRDQLAGVAWYRKPAVLASLVIVCVTTLSIMFW